MIKAFWYRIGFAVVGLIVLAYSTLFTVDETQQSLVFQFGEVRRVEKTPGLKMKVPFLQDVLHLEKRSLEYEKPAFNITLQDQKRIVVDVYALYRIRDPLLFYKAVGDETTASARLDEIIPGRLKAVFGGFSLSQIISESRRKTLEKLLSEVNESAKDLGIEVIDARIRRADLPPKNGKAIFDRMKSERQHAAREIRAQGDELAREIRATAEKERTILIAEAKKNARLIEGKAESEAMRVHALATQEDPEFFAFYRSLEAYRKALKPGSTTYVLSPVSDFFKYFRTAQRKRDALKNDKR